MSCPDASSKAPSLLKAFLFPQPTVNVLASFSGTGLHEPDIKASPVPGGQCDQDSNLTALCYSLSIPCHSTFGLCTPLLLLRSFSFLTGKDIPSEDGSERKGVGTLGPCRDLLSPLNPQGSGYGKAWCPMTFPGSLSTPTGQ